MWQYALECSTKVEWEFTGNVARNKNYTHFYSNSFRNNNIEKRDPHQEDACNEYERRRKSMTQ